MCKIVGIVIAVMGLIFFAVTLNILISIILIVLGYGFYRIGKWVGKQK